MEKSLFLRLRDLEMDHPDGKLTGLQREMLSLFLEVNPDSTMGEALGAVFEYLGEEATEVRLNAIAERLIADRQRGASEAEPEVAKPEAGADVLAKKNATVSVRQIIRELEAAQEPLWSPMVLNGSGYGVLANHSLVMANYISRANAAIIDLRTLLSQG